MGIVAIICIAVVVLAIVIILTVLVYNQMLLLNEVNKRLLLMAKEAVEKERTTQEELQDALVTIEQMSNASTPDVSSQQPADSYGYQDNDLDI